MLTPKHIDSNFLDSTKYKLEGLYFYTDRQSEDAGWNELEHYIYILENVTMWTASRLSSGNYYFNILNEKNNLSPVSPEVFLDFVNKYTPKAANWLIFNIEILGGKK